MKQLFTHFLTGLVCFTFIGIYAPVQAQLTINPNVTHTTCNLCNGSVSFSLSGGVAPHNITWAYGAWVNQPLCTGTYTVTVTDSSGQSATSTFVINSSTDQAIYLYLPQPAHIYYDCYSICDYPYSTIFAPTGFTSYVWSWDGIILGIGQNEITVENEGTYCVTVTNSYGCTRSACVTVFDIHSCSYPDNCGNECMGTAEVMQISGGVLPYTYVWSNGVTGTNIQSDLCSGNYYLTIFDANYSTAVMSFNVQNVQVQENILPANYYYCPYIPISIPVNLSYAYCEWSDGIVGCLRNLTNPGYFSVTVTDSQDCIYSGLTSVSALSPVYITGSSNLTTSNPCTTLSASYGSSSSTSYQWSNGQTIQSIQVCSPGVYCVTATSSTYNCTSSKCLTVTSTVVTSVPDISASNETVRIWQNPENKTLHIIPQLTNHTSDLATLTFYDVAGRVLLTTNIPLDTPAYIDIAHWQPGIYYWQLTTSAANLQSFPITGKVWVL